MDRNAAMDCGLRKGLCDLPTKQNHDPQKENTALPHHDQRRHSPFPTNCDGPYHWTSAATWVQCHTNHRRPWMFPRSHLPSVLGHHHGSRDCTTLSGLCLPMVWPADEN